MTEMRIQKFLSAAGAASRRHAERLMTAGRVTVNGEVVTELGVKIDPEVDEVALDGERVGLVAARWIMLNKPPGHLTTRRDVRGRRTVYDILPTEEHGLRYVGRLDRDTEGLLLFTNEGEVSHALLHPSNQIAREYEAMVQGPMGKTQMSTLEAGVDLEDGFARAEAVRTLSSDVKRSTVRLIVREGRKREVRRLFDAIDRTVLELRRVRFGPIQLGTLPRGEFRALNREEVAALHKSAATSGNLPRPRK